MKARYFFVLCIILTSTVFSTPIFAAQVTQINNGTSDCSDFTKDLRFNITSDKNSVLGLEILKLQEALTKEGFVIRQSELGIFGTDTFLAVIGFQEKYKDDILIAVNLKKGTGFVGSMTRKKLISLYGCNNQVVSTPLKPNSVRLNVKGILIDKDGIAVTFCNFSLGDISTFPVRVRLNGIVREFDIQSAHKANTCYPARWSYETWGLSYDQSAMYSVIVSIDPFGYYKEGTLQYPDLENLTIPAVQGVHLGVRSLSFKNSVLQATFCNIGTVDIANFPANITLNGVVKDFDITEVHKSGKCQVKSWTFDTWGLTYAPGTNYTAVIIVGKDFGSANSEYKDLKEFSNAAAISGTL